MAYLKEGQSMFTLRLWTFVNERFYLILNQNDAAKYLVMTREPNKNPASKNKYFWNIVGNGTIDTTHGLVMGLEFENGAVDRSRTCNPSVRSRVLYPIELRLHVNKRLLFFDS